MTMKQRRFGLERFVAVAALLFAFQVDAQVTWFQVPGQPIWVDAGMGWRANATGANSGLRLERKTGGRIEVYVTKNGQPDALLKSIHSEIASRYPGADLVVDAGTLNGNAPRDNISLEVRGSATMVSRFAVAFVMFTSKANSKVMRQHLKRMSSSVRYQWARPGGGDLAIPESGLILRQPELGWQAKYEANVLRLISATGRSNLEVRAEYRAGQAKAPELLKRWSSMLLPEAISWETARTSKVNGLSCVQRKGVVEVEGRIWTAVVAVVSTGSGHVVVVATEQNFGGQSRAVELETIINSLRQPLR
jgi:hypothetical protein